MKNITHGYANEGAGLTYTGAIRVFKHLETLNMQLRMRSAYDRKWKQTTGNLKQCKSHLTKQLICTWPAVIKTKYAQWMFIFASKPLYIRFWLDYGKNTSKKDDEPRHRPNPTQQVHIRDSHGHEKLNKCKWTDINVLYRYNKTVKVWLFRDMGTIHSPLPRFISLGCFAGNKPGLGVMETAYSPHNHTWTV